ncbi:hypothetical protein EYR41_008954 [Orbilia oligospora]|uniref:Uncharacterized protein n=1 Tax=Orbilia oligospora TaxID=2813651 RepID=A0A8H2HFJ0_ORBOL|nr:hypothetical protein EYR41_008954 [Orbilia oligospora]
MLVLFDRRTKAHVGDDGLPWSIFGVFEEDENVQVEKYSKRWRQKYLGIHCYLKNDYLGWNRTVLGAKERPDFSLATLVLTL